MENKTLTLSGNITVPEVNEYKVVLHCIVLVGSLVGNSLVVAVILFNQNLRTTFNYLVVNMAISDLLMSFLSIPVRIHQEMKMIGSWPDGHLGDALCKLTVTLGDMSPTVSIFTLVVVAVERFTAIVYSSRVYVIDKRKTMILIALTWILALAVYIPYLYGYKVNMSRTSCELDLTGETQKWFFIMLLIVVFTIPFTAITILYTTMVIKLREASKNIGNMLDSQQVRARHRRNRNILCLSVVIIASFALLWGPFFACTFAIYIVGVSIPNSLTIFIVDLLGLTNCCVNPCIYFLFQKNYRQGLWRICQRLLGRSTTALDPHREATVLSKFHNTRNTLIDHRTNDDT